jgi:hypothetical protein
MSSSKPPLRVAITDVVSDSGGKTRYRLFVSTDCCQWDLFKRYSEIDILRKSLVPKFSSVRSSERFFPPKKVLIDDGIVKERKEMFHTWFAAICSDTNVLCDTSFLFFLQIDNMWRAISAGDARYVELLLSARVAVAPHPDDPELLPLHHICKKGFVSCAEAILRSMQPKDCSMWLTKLDANGMSPVHIAAAEGHNALIALLLQYGASPALNSRSAGTPLHVALLCNRTEIIEQLVSAIAADGDRNMLDLEDKKGRSPLHYAVHRRMRSAAQLLLKFGASIAQPEHHARLSVAERHCSGHTVLHVAASLNDLSMMRVSTRPSSRLLMMFAPCGLTRLQVLFAHMRQSTAAHSTDDSPGSSIASPSLDMPALLSQVRPVSSL